MAVPGGGFHSVGRGQVAMNGEMTLCLLKALVDGNRDLVLNRGKGSSLVGAEP